MFTKCHMLIDYIYMDQHSYQRHRYKYSLIVTSFMTHHFAIIFGT